MTHASSHSMRTFKIALRSDRGQAQVEFALVVIFLFTLVLFILETLFFMHTYNVLADSAKEGVRYAIVHGANNSLQMPPSASCTATSCACPCLDIDGPPASPGTVPGYGSGKGVVKTFAQYSLHDTSAMTVSVTYGPADTPAVTPLNKTPNRVQVVVAYPYHPFFGLGWPTVQVNAAAEGRIMN